MFLECFEKRSTILTNVGSYVVFGSHFRSLKLEVNLRNGLATTYNVIGKIPGDQEPGSYA